MAPRWTWRLGISALSLAAAAAAESSGSRGPSMSGASRLAGEQQPPWDGAKHFLDLYEPNETRLFWQLGGWNGHTAGGAGNFTLKSELACTGAPFLFTRSQVANGNCPPRLTQLNVSCTCIVARGANEPFDSTNVTALALRVGVKQRASASASLLPASTSVSDVLEVSSIAPLGVPPSLRSLTITGEGNEDDGAPLAISIGKGFRRGPGGVAGGGDLALFQRLDGANVTQVTLLNLDLTNATTSEDFFPPSVVTLTLQNCAVSSFNLPFFRKLGYLAALDLSSNGLTEPYERPQIERCVTGLCLLKSLNLSYNRFTTLPSTAVFYDSLAHLDLTGNPIANLTVSAETFSSISSLASFSVSAQATSMECPSPNTKKMTVHGAEFCVVATSPSGTSNTAGAGALSTTNSYFIFGAIACCFVVTLLVFIIIRQRRSNAKAPSDGYPFSTRGQTTDHGSAFDESFYNTGTANLLNNPFIITRRVQQSDIRLGNCISKGGFGVVYSGVYRRRRRVAIKKIRPEYNTDIKMIETFLNEICLMATLRHPRIVEFIGVAWESPRDLCAITELMERGDVRELLQHQRTKNKSLVTWENEKKTTIALHVAEALSYLHSLRPKVIHRDLKAKNVLLTASFDAKLSDFGISRERHVDEAHMTAAVGTSFWIAPEVLQGRQDYDERADIYSFGVLLCELDTEDYPYWRDNHPERGDKRKERVILEEVASGSLRPEFSASCPHNILALATRCLEREPENRPTAAELVGALGAMRQQHSGLL